MANTRDIRRRIKSVKNIAQITKAMQMVAASKMRRAQEQALAGRPYAALLDEMAASLAVAAADGDWGHALLQARPVVKKRAVLVISTDKGLCGSLNSNLLRELLRADSAECVYVTVGRKGRQFLARLQKNLKMDFEVKDPMHFNESKRVSQWLLDGFLSGEFDQVDVLSSHYINTLSQKPAWHRLLPIGREEIEQRLDGTAGAQKSTYLFEPDPATLLDRLLPFHVHLTVYQKLLDSRASEHSARMVAMKTATDNAKQIIKDLTLEYNKERQASITRELLEIATAQMALG